MTNVVFQIQSNSLNTLGQAIRPLVSGDTVVIITHPDINSLYGDIAKQACLDAGYSVKILEVPCGESSKSMDVVCHLLDQCLAFKLERRDAVIALGGGVIGDLAGFVAAIYLRGIHLIQVPTTLLSQVDSSIGGKTGVNHDMGKNLIGSFYQPTLTLIDPNLLTTLPDREIRCGLAEVIKYGIIMNADLFHYIVDHESSLTFPSYTTNATVWEHIIRQSCDNKSSVVSQDERESGLREILNFGHTIGHAIEAAFNYKRYNHGEAIAIGMIAEALLAQKLGLCDTKTVTLIINLFNQLNFETTLKPIDSDDLIDIMYTDKKVRNKQLRFVLPTQIGQVTTVSVSDLDAIQSVLKEIQ